MEWLINTRSSSVGPASHSLQYWLKHWVPQHTWHHRRLRVKVSQAYVAALAPWKNHQWMEWGVPLVMVCRWKVVSTDASNLGWGALCEVKPAFSLWLKKEGYLHINCLEMMAVCLGLRTFLPDLRGHHVLVRSDSMTVVSYINHQGGLSSRRLFILAKHLLRWAQHNLHSLRAMHVQGELNLGADMLSRSNVPLDEWTLHPQTVQETWGIFGRPEVDLFASEDNKGQGCVGPRLAQPPPLCFSPIALIPQVIRRIREQKHRVLLVAPFWRSQHWFAELARLLTASPWLIPLRWYLLSHAYGTIWHPQPELWALHFLPLDGSFRTFQRVC